MKLLIRNVLAFIVIASTLYSCTMANRDLVASSNEGYNESEDLDVIFTEDLIALGDTSLFKDGYASNDSLILLLDDEGRKVIFRNHKQMMEVISIGSGKIFVKVCMDRKGDAVYTEIDQSNTTITDKRTLSKALNMILGYKFEADHNAPEYQCGMIKLFLEINGMR